MVTFENNIVGANLIYPNVFFPPLGMVTGIQNSSFGRWVKEVGGRVEEIVVLNGQGRKERYFFRIDKEWLKYPHYGHSANLFNNLFRVLGSRVKISYYSEISK